MARPFIIVEFCGGSVRAGLFHASAGADPSFVSLPAKAGAEEAAASVLAALRAQTGADPAACSVYVGVPAQSASIRLVSVPVDRREKINEMLPFELAGVLGGETGEFVMDNLPLGGGRAMAVAMEKKALAGYLGAFAALGIDPVWAGLTGLSIPGLLQELYPSSGTKAFLGDDFISVSREGHPIFFNSFSGTAGLKLNLSYLEAEGTGIDEVYCAAPQGPLMERLFPRAAVTAVAPEPGGAGMAALARDIGKGLARATVNLRKGEFEYTREKAAARKKLRLTFALALVIAGLLLGDSYLRYLSVKGSVDAYRGALREEYARIFPNEKVRVDELYQLSAKLKELDAEAAAAKGRVDVLALMGAMARAAGKDPAMRIRVTELGIAGGKLKASGEASSFDAANRFKELLAQEGAFGSVQISDLKSQGDSGAAFSLLIGI